MGARGLYTSPSQTAGAPEGSVILGENVVVPRPGVYESRRGYAALMSRFPSGYISSLVEYKGVLIGHGNGILARYDNDTNQWVPYGYVAPTLGAVTHTVDAGYTDILPAVSVSSPGVTGPGTVTLVVQNDGTTQTFTWSSTSGDSNATPQAFEPASTVSLVTGTGATTGISVTWGDEMYGPGDTFTFSVTGGSVPTAYLPPNGPIKNADGTLATGKVRFHETGGCLYFTTSKGVFRLEDPLGIPYLSGISQGLPSDAVVTGTSGFLADGYSVAYRETWSKRTADGRVIEGAPSGRVTVFNTVGGGASRNVSRTIPIPTDLPTDAFLRVWRTESFPNALGPGEDYAQVHEKALADIPAGTTSYTFTDITPDAIRGDAAYFSANLGDGLVASKFRPPLATDVLTFRDSTVYVGAIGLESLNMTLLSTVGIAAAFLGNPGDGLVFIFGDGAREEYHATTSIPAGTGLFTVYGDGTPSQNVANTVRSLVKSISTRSGGRLRAFYTSSDDGTPGSFQVEARSLDEPQYTVRAIQRSNVWFPALRTELLANINSRSSNSVSATAFYEATLEPGQLIELVTSPNPGLYPTGVKSILTVPTANTFTYSDVGANTSTFVSGALFLTGNTATDVSSDRQGGPDFVAWTPLGEPDAVPVLQYVRVGKSENSVLPGLVLGNSLYLRKADGLYRLSGDTPATFGLDQVDTTVSFIGPYAGFTLGGSAYSLTTEGLKMWSESGRPQPASVPVEENIRSLIAQNADAIERHAFAVNYESERTMLLWLPSTPGSTRADFAYRYNYLTEAWTTETTAAACALVSPTQDRLFIGLGNLGSVVRELKTKTAADYYEADGSGIPARIIYSPQLGADPSTGKNFNRMKYHVDPTVTTPTAIDVSFSTDWVPTPTEFTIPGTTARGSTFETLVDGQHKRGTRLYVGVAHNTPGEKLALLGYSVTFYEHQLGVA